MSDLPPYASRIRAARERAGLSHEAIAARTGVPAQRLEDLEAFDDELLMTVSLAQVAAFCGAVGVDPAELLAEDAGTRRLEPRIPPEKIADLIQSRLRTRGIPLEELEDEIGWELDGILADPGRLFEFNPDALRDICEALGVDWLRAVPAAERKTRTPINP